MSTFAEFVADAARAAGYDIDSPRGGGMTRLAKDADMSLSSVSRMLSGLRMPTAGPLRRVAKALDLAPEELFARAGIGFVGPSDFQPLPLSKDLIDKLRTLRKIHGVSAQELADRMTAQGFRITRGVIANCENGRVQTLSVDHADHAARALGTTLVQLISEPAECPTCKGKPPTGFTCNTCGGA